MSASTIADTARKMLELGASWEVTFAFDEEGNVTYSAELVVPDSDGFDGYSGADSGPDLPALMLMLFHKALVAGYGLDTPDTFGAEEEIYTALKTREYFPETVPSDD